jgi:uncharacterized repeat protein (TIGR03806 family)
MASPRAQRQIMKSSLLLFTAVVSLAQPAQRVPWTTSRLIGSPDPPPPYRLIRAFPQVTFKAPVFIAQDPLSDRLFIAEYDGLIYSFQPKDPAGKKDLFLDLGRGISAFSFHPKYKENGFVFVFSHADLKSGPRKGQMSRIYRYKLDPTGNPPRLDPASQTIVIEWPSGGHNGGEAIIGPDGYLYVSTGDGTSGSDVNNSGQNLTDLHAVMMRLDVDRPDPGRNYGIPKDNPFIGTPNARPEIWAYGYRNPWRFSFDPQTGLPWVGDVGQDIWEMIEISSKGSNHGWSVREGSHPFHPNTPKGPTAFTDPIVEHHHTECRSITGGYVYQGDKFPELKGVYVYGDYEYGKMWGLRYNHKSKKVVWHKEFLDSNVKIASFGVARDGSFYALDHGSGEIYELDRRPPDAPRPAFPRKLSQTGLFEKVKSHQTAAGVIPYSINAPFWSDGAHKDRFIAMPPTAQITFDEKPDEAWQFDDGAVTVKSFSLDMEEGNAASRKYIETRVVVKQDNHWVGYTYVWNDDQSDATLVAAGGRDKTFRIKEANGGIRKQSWHYPSRNECMFCHSRAAGFVLGLNTGQMNRSNQLHTLSQIGLFKAPLKKSSAELPAYPDPFDAKIDINERAKTYLQVNCAMCHVADGGGNSLMELGYRTPLAKANLVGEEPTHETLGIEDAKLVKAGAPASSVLLRRITRRGEYQMPPTSTNRVDTAGAKLIEDWIRQLPKNAN